MSAGPASSDGLYRVVLGGLPLDVHRRAAAHQDELQREFDVLRTATTDSGFPHRLHRLIDELQDEYGSLNATPRAQLDAAMERGEESMDLHYEVPRGAGSAAQRLNEILDEADELCRQGELLLTLVTPHEAILYRHWYLGEFVRQMAGDSPQSWAEFTRAVATEAPSGSDGKPSEAGDAGVDALSGTAVVRPSGALDLQTSGDLREALQDARDLGAESVTLDLTGVEFLDSVGLSVILRAAHRLTEDGADLEVVVPTHLTAVFRITGADQLLSIRS